TPWWTRCLSVSRARSRALRFGLGWVLDERRRPRIRGLPPGWGLLAAAHAHRRRHLRRPPGRHSPRLRRRRRLADTPAAWLHLDVRGGRAVRPPQPRRRPRRGHAERRGRRTAGVECRVWSL